ncbi:MAG TPA: hypothetical protein VHJ54_05275 [Solirubrobacterales bacterium]|jgi:hypothetical protein|nr:hypothetical protein [Solirubrobacterales bacterium]
MRRRERLMTAFWLAILAYLGFYVYGLIMRSPSAYARPGGSKTSWPVGALRMSAVA